MLRLQNFVKNILSDGDRCTLCTFDDNLVYEQKLQRNVDFCNISTSYNAGTRLYDSICDVTDHLFLDGNTLHSWIVVVITYNNDNVSTRSAYECKHYILTRYASGMQNRYIFIVSVGDNVDCNQLNSLEIDKCLYHMHVKHSNNLETDLIMKICYCKTVSDNTSGIDFVICVNTTAPIASALSMAAALPLPDTPAVPPRSLPPATPSTPRSLPPATPALSAPPAISALPLVIHALPAPPGPPVPLAIPAPPAPPGPPPDGEVTVKMRVFSSRNLHPDDMNIFAKFARNNYTGILTDWGEVEDEMIFLIVIDSNTSCIVGMLMLTLYDQNKAHIGVVVVEHSYRKHGIATNMLRYVANKYINKTVTISITFDRLDLLEFYYDKGYVKFDKFVTKYKLIVFLLVHDKLIN